MLCFCSLLIQKFSIVSLWNEFPATVPLMVFDQIQWEPAGCKLDKQLCVELSTQSSHGDAIFSPVFYNKQQQMIVHTLEC